MKQVDVLSSKKPDCYVYNIIVKSKAYRTHNNTCTVIKCLIQLFSAAYSISIDDSYDYT